MIIATAISKNGVEIRLTDERWNHIIKTHPEIDPKGFSRIIDVIEDPDAILEGDVGEILAVKKSGSRT